MIIDRNSHCLCVSSKKMAQAQAVGDSCGKFAFSVRKDHFTYVWQVLVWIGYYYCTCNTYSKTQFNHSSDKSILPIVRLWIISASL